MSRNNHAHDHDHDTDEEDEMILEAPQLKGVRALPYELILRENISSHDGETIAAIIPLDGSIKSHLNWSDAFQIADTCIEKGVKIIFNLELGLFNGLEHPLPHQGQFQALTLSCDHFRREAVPRFGNSLLGVILYQGAMNTTHTKTHTLSSCWDEFVSWLNSHKIENIPQDETEVAVSPTLRWYYKRFCHEQCIEFIRILSLQIPDTIHRFILLDPLQAPKAHSTYEMLRQCAKDLLDPLAPVVSDNSFILQSSVWKEGLGTHAFFGSNMVDFSSCEEIDSESLSTALLIPYYQTINEEICENLKKAIELIESKGLSRKIRIVHESYFTSEWDGLDTLIYSSKSVQPDGKRSIRGFEAAGGTTIDVDQERGFKDLLSLIT